MAGETYVKRYAGGFADGAGGGTPVDSTFLNAVETALLRLLGEDPAADEVGVWTPASNRFVFQKIANAQIDAAAAIDKSKLGALSIVDADVAGGANIAKSKLALANSLSQPGDFAAGSKITASSMSGGPPGGPTTGDIWIATAAGANGEDWTFRYNGASASAYKWEFIGGPTVMVESSASDTISGVSAWEPLDGMALTLPRAGDYEFIAHSFGSGSTAGAFTLQLGLSVNSTTAIVGTFAGTAATAANLNYQLGFQTKLLSRSAADVIRLMVWQNGTNPTSTYRSLSVRPIRIG